MKKLIFLLFLTSCGEQVTQTSSSSTNETPGSTTECINGASYEVTPNGKFLHIKKGNYVRC